MPGRLFLDPEAGNWRRRSPTTTAPLTRLQSSAELSVVRPPGGRSARARGLLRRLTLREVSTLLGVLGILFVAIVSVVIALKDRRTLHEEARDHAEQTAAFLADHAQRLFEVADIVLHATTTSLGTSDWSAVASSPEIAATVRRVDELLPYVDSVFGADGTGSVRISTLNAVPPNYSVADRSVFGEAQRGTGDTLLVGEPIVGRVSHKPTFLLARRRSAPDGSFDGIVGAAMSLNYFTDYWRSVDKRNDESVALVRGDDGSVLAQLPEIPSATSDRLGTSLVAAIREGIGSAAGLFTPGPHEYGSFHKVGPLPVYVTVVYRDANINRLWLESVRSLALPASLCVAGLVIIIVLARRLARREDRARRRIETARHILSAANRRLETRVAERTAELVESNREIQRFAYIVSHDLRAPLVNIMGFTGELRGCFGELLAAPEKARADDEMRADAEEAFGFIASSIERMDRLIKALLTLSRQGQRPLKPELLDMTALVRSAVDALAHQVQVAGATVTVGLLPDITADRIAVEQVFANLIDNAVKYLRPGTPGLIRIEGRRNGPAAIVTVVDNGRGIAPADRERVFELFRRAGRQDLPGEGIGLAHVRSLVRRLQGTIVLEDAQGPGCTFTIALPLAASLES